MNFELPHFPNLVALDTLMCRLYARLKARHIENQTKDFIAFGFTPDELTVVENPDGQYWVTLKK